VVLYANHPDFWDPIVCALVCKSLLPTHQVFALVHKFSKLRLRERVLARASVYEFPNAIAFFPESRVEHATRWP
jgi:hypothetical protein